MVSYFQERQHYTRFHGAQSEMAAISASVIQGSVIGATAFAITASDLKPTIQENHLPKYADDMNLIVPASQVNSIEQELNHITKWASTNNLNLNHSKSKEIVFARKRGDMKAIPSTNSGIQRVDEIKLLGVTLDHRLRMERHTLEVISKCSQSLYALRILRAHGMNQIELNAVFKATVIPKLLYAAPAWWGFATQADRARIETYIRKSVKFGYYTPDGPTAADLVSKADNTLFRRATAGSHVLKSLLPEAKTHSHNLRARVHNFILPDKDDKNFIPRMLYHKVY